MQTIAVHFGLIPN